jgi:hypothetical protein
MPALKVWVANERLTSTDLNANFASVQTPDGVVASAASTTVVSTPITLNAVVEGKASYLSGGRIVTPRAGLYLVSGLVSIGTPTTGSYGLTVLNTPLDFAFYNSGTATKILFSLPCVLASGVQITAQFTSPGGTPSLTINRLGFLFLGTGYAP